VPQRAEIVRAMRDRAGARDGNDAIVLPEQPDQRQLGETAQGPMRRFMQM